MTKFIEGFIMPNDQLIEDPLLPPGSITARIDSYKAKEDAIKKVISTCKDMGDFYSVPLEVFNEFLETQAAHVGHFSSR